jgi:hypothetical protein
MKEREREPNLPCRDEQRGCASKVPYIHQNGTKLANIVRAILGVHTIRPELSNGMRTPWCRATRRDWPSRYYLQAGVDIWGHLR